MPSEAELQALLDKQAITEVVFRYARGVDRLDLPLILSCFHPGAYDDHGFARGDAVKVSERIVRQLGRTTTLTTHHLGQVLVELEGETAHVESYVYAFHRQLRDGAEVDWLAHGRYIDRFERREGEWRIANRKVVHSWDRTDPVVERSDETARWWNAGARSQDDPVYHPLPEPPAE